LKVVLWESYGANAPYTGGHWTIDFSPIYLGYMNLIVTRITYIQSRTKYL